MHKPHLSVDVGVVGVVVVEMVEVGDNRLANGGVIGFRVGAGGPRIPGGGGCGGGRAGPVGEEDMTNYGYNLQYCGIPTQIGKPIFIPISPKKAHFSAKNGYISFLPILYLDFGTISHHQGHKICRFRGSLNRGYFFHLVRGIFDKKGRYFSHLRMESTEAVKKTKCPIYIGRYFSANRPTDWQIYIER